jgi:protein TonB
MVLVQSYSRRPAPQRPNPARITGISLAVALNLAVLFAMTVLMKPPLVLQKDSGTWIVQLPEAVDPPPPPPPETVPVQRRSDPAPTQPPSPPQPATAPRSPSQPLVATPTPAATPDAFSVPEPDPAVATPATGPVAGVRLEYASAPAPRYTADLVRDQAQGTVMLQVLVDTDGRPLQVSVHASSGNRRLDRLAQQHVLKHWTFRPAMRDGRAVQAIGLVPIDFKLQ